MNRLPKVSVVITAYNRKIGVLRLLRSILSSQYQSSKLQIIIVDDASIDHTIEAVESFKNEVKLNGAEIILLKNKESKYVSACQNMGIRIATGEYIMLIHDDEVLGPASILELVAFMEKNKDVGISSPVVFYLKEPTKVWCAGVKLDRILNLALRMTKVMNTPTKCEAVLYPMLIRSEVCSKVGFDSRFLPLCGEDIDFCLNVANLGYKIAIVPTATAWHERPSSSGLHEVFYIRSPNSAYYQPRSSVLMCKVLQPRGQRFILTLLATTFSTIITVFISSLVTRKAHIPKNLVKGFAHGLVLMRSFRRSMV